MSAGCMSALVDILTRQRSGSALRHGGDAWRGARFDHGQGGLVGMLDRDGDGSAVDDLLGAATRMFGKR